MNINSDKSESFYNKYFEGENYLLYKYDVGAFCTRGAIKSLIKNKVGNLLEIGTGLYPVFFDLPQFNCFGVDISKKSVDQNIELAKKLNFKAEFKIANAEKLPFDSNLFDVIVSSHTLEHIKDDEAVIKECLRILKLGGEAIFFVPGRIDGTALKSEWEKLGHYRSYNKKRFLDLEKNVASELKITNLLFPHKIHNLIWNNFKPLIRWINYPIKRYVKRDNLGYEFRSAYQKYFLPVIAGILDNLDKLVMKKEKNFFGTEFNVLVRFEKKSDQI
ncbi:MAG: class I SAM-dependent methyltransferase [bacterium]